MPGQLFTDAERRRLGGFPAQLSHEDQVTFYTLTTADRALVNQYADETSRLGFALQLGTLRHLGFCPDDLGAAPSEVVRFLADQVKVAPGALSAYGRRAQTRTDHFLAVQDHLGYRKAGPEERERLARWLLDRALEHDRPLLLWQLACEKLASEKVVRPGVTVLERMVVAARRGAERETMKRLAAVLDEPARTEAGRGCDLADGQPRLMGHDDGPDPLDGRHRLGDGVLLGVDRQGGDPLGEPAGAGPGERPGEGLQQGLPDRPEPRSVSHRGLSVRD